MSENQAKVESQPLLLGELIQFNDSAQIEAAFGEMPPVEMARMISSLNKADHIHLLELLGPEKSASIISKILRHMKKSRASEILHAIKPQKVKKLERLMRYPENTSGGLMITEYLSYPEDMRVREVLDDLREHGETYSDFDIQYAYVVSKTGHLSGVLRLRDLLMAPRDRLLSETMIKSPLHVNLNASLRDLKDFFRQYTFLGAPVTDDEGKLVGVIRSSSVREAANRQNNQLFLKFAGIVGGEESRSMSLFKRSSRRLSWLSINIVLNIMAASVIALYQDTLEKAIVLAVFLPIISDMSGCSGNQAVAVSIRELTLGLVRPKELLRVLTKESSIGIINGLVLGCLLGGAALLWKGNPYLGLIVGAALAANTLVAVSFGGLVPLILRGLRTDPALASGPLLTTVTDICGFFFVLSFASILLPRLAG
jgi:magnesium transporter